MVQVQLPLIVIEAAGDLSFFKSIGDLEKALEPIDVRAGEYTAFDAAARGLSLIIGEKVLRDKPWYLGGTWKVEIARVKETAKESSPALLREYLEEGLRRLDVEPSPTESLSGLISLGIEHWGWS